MNIGMFKLLLYLGRELHPLKSSAFHGALLRQLDVTSMIAGYDEMLGVAAMASDSDYPASWDSWFCRLLVLVAENR
jgi:hypothetical protein